MKIHRWYVLGGVVGVPVAVLIGFLQGEEQVVVNAMAAFGVIVWLIFTLVVLSGLVGWAFHQDD